MSLIGPNCFLLTAFRLNVKTVLLAPSLLCATVPVLLLVNPPIVEKAAILGIGDGGYETRETHRCTRENPTSSELKKNVIKSI